MSAKMKFLSFAGILLILCACACEGVPISYDFTDPVNAIRSGNIAVNEFSTNIKSHFENLKTPLKLSVVYSADCNIFVDCGSTVKEVVQILHGVKKNLSPQKVDIEHFNFRFRIDISALESFDESSLNPTKLSIPAGTHDISFLLPDNTTCDDLQNVTFKHWSILRDSSIWVSPDSVPNVRNMGFGYNEDLIRCGNILFASVHTKYLLTNFRLGKTSCVVEAFGLFKKRIEDLHARNAKFVGGFQFIDYSSTSHCLGDEYYLHLLEKYWERYSNNKIGATILMPVGRYEIPSDSDIKIIPFIGAEYCDGKDIPWYGPAALETLSRHFGALLLTHDEWKVLRSTDTNGKPDIRLDLFIDYTDWLLQKLVDPNIIGRDYNWSVVEMELNELGETTLNPLQNVKVTTLLFPLTPSPTAENFTAKFNRGFARRMSSRLRIGCAFGSSSLGTLANSTSSYVVAACNQVNGSLYTLQWQFKLKSTTKENQDFENVLWPKLEEMRKLREEILVLHPQATVYFKLRFELEMDDNQATVFCNSEAFSLNKYIEATVEWATLNSIPLIMGRAFDDSCNTEYQTWFSVLRPTKYGLKHFLPHFIVRNSPKILAEVDVEPCLEWLVPKPKVQESYFHNNYLGSDFNTFWMRPGKPITQEENKILLQLIFHRFDLVLVEVTRDTYNDFIQAVNTLASEGLIGPAKKFFIFYDDRRELVDKEKLWDVYGFLNFTKVTLGSNISLLKGISFGFEFVEESESRFEENYDRHKMMAVERGRSLNLDMAVEIRPKIWENIHMNATSRKHISKEYDKLLHTTKYIFCNVYVYEETYGNPKTLGTLFDSHLYVKMFFQEFYPHLDVYFRVEVNVHLTETEMNDYLILLSHFKKFAATYNLSYILVQAFDWEDSKQNGWWKVSNNSNLSLTSNYEEKYSAFSGFPTWLPPLHFKPSPTTNIANENQTTYTANNSKQNIVFGATISGLVVLILALGFVLWYHKNKKPQYLSNEEENEFYNGKEATGEEQVTGDSEYLKFDKKFELAFADVFIDPKDLLGRGNFGIVYKGLVKEEPVAIKRPNDNCPATSFKSVLGEIKLLCYIGTHPNVVQFVGAYTKEIRRGILYIATELCTNGSLDGWLRKKKRVVLNVGDADNETIATEDEDSVYSNDLHRMAKEIASGMDYIAGKNVIHGDLSARNVLLDENFTCKIGDFGLSRKLYEYLEYVKKSQEPLPWKWMAYESLENMHFTSKSDVWSYGVTLWEIYSLGKVPYGGLSWTTGFADDLKNGLRLQMPEYATEEIYKAMLICWELEADERPTFTDIVAFFKPLTSSQYTVLEI